MDGSIVKVVPDAGAAWHSCRAARSTIWHRAAQPDRGRPKRIPNLMRWQYNDDGYDYIGLNLANPDNPQNGRG